MNIREGTPHDANIMNPVDTLTYDPNPLFTVTTTESTTIAETIALTEGYE
jgi:hypothetical protein